MIAGPGFHGPPRTARLRQSTFGAGTAIKVRSRGLRPAPGRPPAELTPEQSAVLHARSQTQTARETVPVPAGRPPVSAWARSTPDSLPMRLHNGQVQVRLPFKVDVVRLSQHLVRSGYRVAYSPPSRDDSQAYDPDPPGTQSWGAGYDPEGYYPYSIFPDPDAPETGSVFAFPPRPEDIIEQEVAGRVVARVDLGDASQEKVDHWIAELAALAVEREVTAP